MKYKKKNIEYSSYHNMILFILGLNIMKSVQKDK